MQLKISSKLLLLVVGISLVSIATIISFISSKSVSMQEEAMKRESENIAEKYAVMIGKKFEKAMLTSVGVANFFASDATNHLADKRASLDAFIHKTLENNTDAFCVWTAFEPNAYDNQDALYVNTQNGTEIGRAYCSYHRPDNVVKREMCPDFVWELPIVTLPKQRLLPTLIEPYYFPNATDPKKMLQTSMVAPIIKDSKFIGASGVVFDLGLVQKEIEKIKVLETGYVFLVSHGGLIASHHKSDLITKPVIDFFTESKDEIQDAIKMGKLFVTTKANLSNGEMSRYVFYPIEVLNSAMPWSLVVVMPEDEVFAASNSLKWFSILLGVISLIVVGIVFYIAIRRVIKPIETITEAAKLLAIGDIKLSGINEAELIKLSKRQDEIGAITLAFESLKTAISDISDELIKTTHYVEDGKLDYRSNANNFSGAYQDIIKGVNNTLDAIIRPLNVAAEYIDRISKGDIPPKISEDYRGDFNEIKNNINQCIDAINHLINDSKDLFNNAIIGNINIRADVNKHQGEFRNIMKGVNATLDRLVGLIDEMPVGVQIVNSKNEILYQNKIVLE